MARIRSIHPEQWCDEDFVELSMAGRLLAIGLRNFSDDKGVFEWKPKTIKMKVFPADDVNIDAELDALLMHDQCIKFEVNGKAYGAIRNFRKYQRPKKPNNIYPITETASLYVGLPVEEWSGACAGKASLKDASIPHQFPTSSEIAPQMEDGGCRVEVGKPTNRRFDAFWAVWPNKVSKQSAAKAFKKLKPEDQDKAVRHAEDWFSRWRTSNPQASPIHATTYLNNSRWEDQLPTINGGRNDPRTDQNIRQPRGRSGTSKRSDPALEQALRLTGLS